MNNDLPTVEQQEKYVQHALDRSEKLRKKKKHKEGIDLLVDALQYGINKAMIYYRLGNLYIDSEDLDRAQYAYKRALDVDEHHVNAMHNLAVVYKRQGKVSQYVKTYKKAQRLRLRHPPNMELDKKQKSRLRRLAFKTGFWMIVAVVAVIATVIFLLR